ncbi:hypothetical protein EKI51_10125 [Corynebacterium sanguinis]|uniref:hypothetical protein n=1 Tax=Corynebacterium sanguinis TaxID=2594913 RepID=UPI00119E3815|nr:hypothetical protein [Corynebacterium sanguinis]TVS22077.1 hypothetical protein EKI51_10125 [Corynebacterium sanguinis]
MGFLLGRKDRERTSKRRGEVAKKSAAVLAAVLAAVAVAGGSAVVGMPAAEAVIPERGFFFRKVDDGGELLGGSRWKIEYDYFSSYLDDGGGTLEHRVIYVGDGLQDVPHSDAEVRSYLKENFGAEHESLYNKEKGRRGGTFRCRLVRGHQSGGGGVAGRGHERHILR